MSAESADVGGVESNKGKEAGIKKGGQRGGTAGFGGEQKHGDAGVLLEAVHNARTEVVLGGTVQANAS